MIKSTWNCTQKKTGSQFSLHNKVVTQGNLWSPDTTCDAAFWISCNFHLVFKVSPCKVHCHNPTLRWLGHQEPWTRPPSLAKSTIGAKASLNHDYHPFIKEETWFQEDPQIVNQLRGHSHKMSNPHGSLWSNDTKISHLVSSRAGPLLSIKDPWMTTTTPYPCPTFSAQPGFIYNQIMDEIGFMQVSLKNEGYM